METKTYTKKDIARRVAALKGTLLKDTATVVDGIFEVMREMLSEANTHVRIEVRDFGVLEARPTKAKPRARNPRTNEEIYVPPHRKTHFKAGRLLKSALKK
jgi:nucleoid DNA-binding protein